MSEDKNMNGAKMKVSVPLPEYIEQIIHRTVEKAQASCPIISQVKKNTEALAKNQKRWIALIAFSLGSGLASGTTVYGIMKAFGG